MKRARCGGWPTLADAMAALAEETGAVWHVWKRTQNKKGMRVLVFCDQYRRCKCSAKISFICPAGDTFWTVDHLRTSYDHQGHPVGTPRPPSPLRPADAPVASEMIRHLRGGSLLGLQPTAYQDPLARYALSDFRVDRCRRRVFKPVHRFASFGLFEQVLRDEDRAYFAWWHDMVNDPLSPPVLLRVAGASALEVQRSLMKAQTAHALLTKGEAVNSGHARHAVFSDPADPDHSTLLAINVYALRCYRLISMLWLDQAAAMPMAPVLLQAWSIRPVTEMEFSVRRFGMLAVLLFLQRTMGRSYGSVERHMYSVNEPGFEIYDKLPLFLMHFAETDADLRLYLYMSLHAAEPSKFDLSAVLAAFMFQKHRHHMNTQTVNHLFAVFNHGPRCARLQKKHPQAWRIIQSMRNKANGVDTCVVKLTKVELTKEALPLPPVYYMYQLALDPEPLLLAEDRFDICVNTVLAEVFPIVTEHSVSTHYEDLPRLKNYTYALARPSTDEISLRMRPFSQNKQHHFPLATLFSILRAFDYHRHKGAYLRTPTVDLMQKPPPEFVDGPLTVHDPVAFALYYADLPLARYARREPKLPELPELAYMDETLWVWQQARRLDLSREEEEAELLVRDPAFYVK